MGPCWRVRRGRPPPAFGDQLADHRGQVQCRVEDRAVREQRVELDHLLLLGGIVALDHLTAEKRARNRRKVSRLAGCTRPVCTSPVSTSSASNVICARCRSTPRRWPRHTSRPSPTEDWIVNPSPDGSPTCDLPPRYLGRWRLIAPRRAARETAHEPRHQRPERRRCSAQPGGEACEGAVKRRRRPYRERRATGTTGS
jgi:hypothetical protein